MYKHLSELTVEPVLVILRTTFSRTFLPTESLHRAVFSWAVAHIAVPLSPGRPGSGLAVLLHLPAVVAVEDGRPVPDVRPHAPVENILIQAFVQLGLH